MDIQSNVWTDDRCKCLKQFRTMTGEDFSPLDWNTYSLEDWLEDQEGVKDAVANSEELQELVEQDDKDMEAEGKNFDHEDEISAAE